MLAASIKRWGQPQPVLVRTENKMLISGHGVALAMQKAGETQIDVLLWDVDQSTADAFMLAANRLGELSYVDPGRRRELLIGMAEDDWPAVGFLPDDVAELLAAQREEIAVREIETSEVSDRFWLSVRGPLVHQAVMLQRLQEAAAGIPDVEVTLGTINNDEPPL